MALNHGSGRIQSLDTLRGLAALSVCWFHFVGNRLIGEGWLATSGKRGFVGVYVFFVISGFVLPLALYREGYQLRYYKTYLLKRFARIYPAYLASVAISFGFLVLYSLYREQPRVAIDSEALLLHLALLNEYFDKPWLNTIYWTLVVEVQFYFAIGLLFQLAISSKRWSRIVVYAARALPVLLLPGSTFLFSNAFLFLTGIVTFQWYVGLIKRFEYFALIVVFAVCGAFSLNWLAAVVGVATISAINLLKNGNASLASVGKVSYSVYLLHGSIGSFVLYGLLAYVVGDSQIEKAFAVLFSIGVSLGAAALSYKFIEKPAMQYSGALEYVQSESEEPAFISLPLAGATVSAKES